MKMKRTRDEMKMQNANVLFLGVAVAVSGTIPGAFINTVRRSINNSSISIFIVTESTEQRTKSDRAERCQLMHIQKHFNKENNKNNIININYSFNAFGSAYR